MPWPKPMNSGSDGDKLYAEKDKVIKVQLLADEPELYMTHYVDGKSVKCGAPDCQNCAQGAKQIQKGSILVRDIADGKEKKLGGTAALFIALKETIDMVGSRNGVYFGIKATGQKTARRYHVSSIPMTQTAITQESEEVPF